MWNSRDHVGKSGGRLEGLKERKSCNVLEGWKLKLKMMDKILEGLIMVMIYCSVRALLNYGCISMGGRKKLTVLFGNPISLPKS